MFARFGRAVAAVAVAGMVVVGLTVLVGVVSGAENEVTSGPVPADVELPEETVDVEPEADYETYLEVVGGEPLVESAPVAAGGPFRVGDDVAMTLPFDSTSGDAGNMTAEWTWGDGGTSAGTIAPGPSPVVTGAHAYALAGTYLVTVTITGPDGAATSSAATVVVGAEAAGGGAQALPHPRR